jgi:hypothetical protein
MVSKFFKKICCINELEKIMTELRYGAEHPQWGR